jgi:hypothetical protein
MYQNFVAYACSGDPHAVCGSGVECGESNLNTVIFHQWEQKGFPTSGVSSSPNIKSARFYALCGGKAKKGYIFKLSIKELIKCGVSIYRVKNLVPIPAIPEDDEHILVAKDFGKIPELAIINIVPVKNAN